MLRGIVRYLFKKKKEQLASEEYKHAW
jgi:hypothetical protein